jgi:NADH-quinone oxidoreductase subunit C
VNRRAARGRAEPEPVDEMAALSPEGRRILDVVAQALKGRKVETGALLDRPRISIDAADVADVCLTLKTHPMTAFTTLLCVAAVDYKDYIQMVYLLHSSSEEQTLAVKIDLPYENPRLPSLTSIWRAADWYEREAHDLFGVEFEGHPDLSPLLLYEGFEGHPGLKAFPFHDYDEY